MSTFANAQYRASMADADVMSENRKNLLSAVEAVMAMTSREGISINKITLNGPCYEIKQADTPYGMVCVEESKT